MDLKTACRKINNFARQSLTAEQKKLIKYILEKVSKNNEVDDKIIQHLTLIIQTGFVFDKVPQVEQDNIPVIQESKNYRKIGSGSIDHSLIFGNNLEVLKNLQLAFQPKIGRPGLIDIIYTNLSSVNKKQDEKQNFKNKNLFTFHLNKFKANGWLNQLKEKLKITKNLLTDEGVIFISIDESEYAYLKVLCDEIFGEDNFIATLVRPSLNKEYEALSVDHEYIACYGKNKKKSLLEGSLKPEEAFKYKDEHYQERGKYNLEHFEAGSLDYTPSLDYPIQAPDGTLIYPGHVSKEEHLKRKANKKPRNDWRWMISKSTYDDYFKDGSIVFRQNKQKRWSAARKSYQFIDVKGNPVHKLWKLRSIIESPKDAENNHKFKSLGLDNFNRLKLIQLLKKIIRSFDPKKIKKSIFILDFKTDTTFLAQAVMELNQEDNYIRKCLFISNNKDPNLNKTFYNDLLRLIENNNQDNSKKYFSNGELFEPFVNNTVNIFEINYHDFRIDQDPDYLLDLVKSELIKLNPKFKFNDRVLNNQLSTSFLVNKTK
ncbi:DNA methyltransferase [Mycoplasma sp. SG1]|uniref:DNA methyltransferase n=1 Tax=Mycoplasma sp. SG1 TaxID=2810348 RepID=UPI002024E238|nr:site-specific DNA-methyltransferase [Mycoplasma sp. SG1]URM52989.1 site-specific DNA-methyltransferase [Mycoplasma sp. SG1]